ncbi:MAG: 3-hydroxyacyl-CoA dehydrogenase NAD-binding domain-containing protein [Proteobacteria bacterium]|nr:3-hydroxyacyl-CoA dehydrogenase NAD-binding domain-containing protein [Pseudomonadota bacterium]
MSHSVSYTKDGDIGIITVNNPPVNALSQHVRAGLSESFIAANSDPTVATILICDGRTFIAGADITEFGRPMETPNFLETLLTMENMSKPVIAAIHGTALGGGLETALCCHYRVAVPSARVGLPEVHLGLLPGAGGTQRLPRLIGAQAAVDAIANGVQINAKAAHAAGVIDELVEEGKLLEGAKAFARKIVANGAPLKKVRDMNEKVTGVDPAIFEKARATAMQTRRGFKAPLSCIACVEAACTLPFEEGMARERELFQELHDGMQSAAQRHIFFSERAASKVDDMPKDVKLLDVKTVGVIGAGTMGGGIAMNFANVGIPVFLLETKQEFLDKGLAVVRGNYERTAKKGRLTTEQVEQRMGLITPTLDYADLGSVDMIIEAVFENMPIKKEVFAKLDEIAKPGCILATNTSTLDVDEIAAVTKRPEFVIGTHFFSPANVMQLLEIVRGAKTSFEVLATTLAVAKTIKKIGVVVGVCDGFVGNRMIHQYLAQGQYLLEEGCLPDAVDAPVYDLGFAMGPLTMSDLAGLDVGWRIRQGKGLPASLPAGQRYCEIGDRICEQGRFGQKTGGGFYNYDPSTRSKQTAPEIEKLIVDYSKEKGIKRRKIDSEEVLERLMYALINEGAWILEEGIAQRASDIDVIYVYGYGVPAYLGGPMFYADQIGLDKVYKRVCEFAEQDPASWKPAPLLKKLAEQGATFN